MCSTSRRAFLQASAGAAIAAGVPRARADDRLELKFGNDLPASHSVNVRLVEAIQAIKEETKGRLAINLFPNNQLGSDSDMISQLRSGALEMATMPSTVLSTLIPTASLTGVGYAFKDYNQVWAAADGELGAYIGKAIQKVGLVPFEAMWDNGFRQITSSTHPVKTPDDLKGFKIRVPVVQLWVQMFAAFGAAPTTIPLAEAYSALQTKIADGQENPLVLIEAAKFYEVQKYCSLTNHAWDGFWLLASGKRWKEGTEGPAGGHGEAFQRRRQEAAARRRERERGHPKAAGGQRIGLQHD